MFIKIFSGTAKATAGTRIAKRLPTNYKKVLSVVVSSPEKVELSLTLDKIGAVLQRVEFAPQELDGELEQRLPQQLEHSLKSDQVQGVVRSLSGSNQTVKVFLKVE